MAFPFIPTCFVLLLQWQLISASVPYFVILKHELASFPLCIMHISPRYVLAVLLSLYL